MVPSDKQLTVTPCGPTSAARPREKPMAAAFAAPYTTCLRSPRRPASETIVSTLPQERSIIAGRYARVTPSTAARFRRMSGSHSSGPVSTKFFTVMPSGRTPLRPLVDEPAQGAPRVPADRLEVGGALIGRLRQRGEHRGLAVLEQLVGFGCVDPAARHDLGPGDHLARGGVDSHDHHDHTLLGEAATVAQHAVAHVADDAVDVEIARRHRPPV